MSIDRRRFSFMLGALMAAGQVPLGARAAATGRPTPQPLHFKPDGGFPNSRFPALLYRGVMPAGTADPAAAFEALFAKHQWPPQWRYGMYPFDHFHSTAHEALGIVSGHARVRLGGPDGREFDVQAGDALVLPAGTGHCNRGSSEDFLMVGAYPAGQQWDLMRGDPAELAAAEQRIAKVPMPADDPVGGSLLALWKV